MLYKTQEAIAYSSTDITYSLHNLQVVCFATSMLHLEKIKTPELFVSKELHAHAHTHTHKTEYSCIFLRRICIKLVSITSLIQISKGDGHLMKILNHYFITVAPNGKLDFIFKQ